MINHQALKIIILLIFFFSFDIPAAFANTIPDSKEEKPEQIEVTPKVSDYIQNLRDGVEEARKDPDIRDCKLVLDKVVSRVEQKEKFAAIAKSGRSTILYYLVECALITDDYELALTHIENLINAIENKGFQLSRWFHLSRVLEKPEQSQKALQQIATKNPDLLSKIEQKDFREHWRQIKSMSNPQKERFLMAGWLVNNNYIPPSKTEKSGNFNLYYAKGLMRNNQTKQAEKVLTAYPDEVTARDVQSLNLFAPLRNRSGFSKKYDILAGLQAQMAWEQKTLEENPDNLEITIRLMGSYQYLGQFEQAKQLGLNALKRIENTEDDKNPPFGDLEDQYNWLLNEMASNANNMGEIELAIDYYRKAIDREGKDNPNIGQRINLSIYLMKLAQTEQALQEIAKINPDDTSNYGKALVHYVRACSYAQTGNNIQMDFEISKLHSLKSDNPVAMSLALLCTDREDEAAASYINRLSKQQQDEEALTAFFRYQPSVNPSDWQLVLQARLAELAKRSDVKAAIAKVGRIIDVPFTSESWGDI